jgi:hypothetical protein
LFFSSYQEVTIWQAGKMSDLHPKLQPLADEFVKRCKAEGIDA